jgi:DNA-binding transcriptional ArsR family regulator
MAKQAPARAGGPQWTFLTNYGHVFLCLAKDPGSRLRDVAAAVGITERAVQRIVADLEEAGYLRRSREGRRNAYEVDPDRPLRHPVESHQAVRSLLALIHGRGADADTRRRTKSH